jgi:MOSC domain-containing protein YiiM
MLGTVIGLHANPNGGVPKHPVPVLEIKSIGCVGDKQNDKKHHGGVNKAVCLMEESILQRLQEAGHPIFPGSTGENVLIQGLPTGALRVGTRLSLGDVVLEITGDAPPCKTIRESFQDGFFMHLSNKREFGTTRWYARVLVEGALSLNDQVRLLSGDEPVESP